MALVTPPSTPVCSKEEKWILCPSNEINLEACLMGGQSFTWIKISPREYANTISDTIVILSSDEQSIYFSLPLIKCQNELAKLAIQIRAYLIQYFRLDSVPCLEHLYNSWSQNDLNFAKIMKEQVDLLGIRQLRQDPIEVVFSFICSQNNALPRITSMVLYLKSRFGKYCGSISRTSENGQLQEFKCYTFPSINSILKDSDTLEDELKSERFGYRAKYIYETAKILKENPSMLEDFSNNESDDNNTDMDDLESQLLQLQKKLRQFPGVGPKVADCIALMGLNWLSVVPVDTHIHRMSMKTFTEKRSLTATQYVKIGQDWRQRFGIKAGWAQTVLFVYSLRTRGSLSRKRIKNE